MATLPFNDTGKPKMYIPNSKFKPTEKERVIYNFENGTYLCYDQGEFDKYCIFIRSETGLNLCPQDKDYFGYAQKLGRICTNWKLYKGFLNIYTRVVPHQEDVSEADFEFITKISKEYTYFEEEVFLLFLILYAAMIAEENWRDGKTYVGKEMKKVGMFKAVMANVNAKEASDCLRTRNWKAIHKESIEIDHILDNLTDTGRTLRKWRREPTSPNHS